MDQFFLLALIWTGSWFIEAGVGEFYHPMAARGDMFHSIRQWSVALPLLTALAIAFAWLLRRPLPPRAFVVGTCVIVAGALLPLLPRVDSGYEQDYWIGDQRYSIPWAYGPYNGQASPGGRFFLVMVSPNGLAPRYETDNETIIIGMASDNTAWKHVEVSTGLCLTDQYRFECSWQADGVFYRARGDPEHKPDEPMTFAVEVTDLLDGFAVDSR
ncbi:MAG: hypothetical protein GY717_18385 [Rhodobacteraceae bacterium]|nr:hypothetical protein [Paracoccaceae bacterium]